MRTPTMLRKVKKVLMPGVFVAALIAMTGLQGAGAAAQDRPPGRSSSTSSTRTASNSNYVLERDVTTSARRRRPRGVRQITLDRWKRWSLPLLSSSRSKPAEGTDFGRSTGL